MAPLVNRIGMRYGRLVVMSRHASNKWGDATWYCKCDCGNAVIVCGNELRCSKTRSCGCLKSDSKKKHKNPMWNGGIIITGGYRQVKFPEHHHANNQGYVQEHILVMEGMIGRLLNIGEVVHHRNGIRDDNRPENLQLFGSVREHTAFHHKIGSFKVREVQHETTIS